MTIYRVQTALKSTSGRSEDTFTNTIHVSRVAGDASAAQATAIAQAVRDFYAADPAGDPVALRYWLSPEIAQDGHLTRVYRLLDDKPRVPVAELEWSFGSVVPAAGKKAMPAEVSLCLSLKGARISGTNAARRRGRIYVGPFNEAANDNDAASHSRPSPFLRGDLVAAGQRMTSALNALGVLLGIYSTVNNGFVAMDSLSVDDAWDTQRRRGQVAAVRSTSIVTQVALGA